MNETLRTIKDRYSCRAFEGRAVEKDKLEALALSALQAPSARNTQPWKIVVVTDKNFLDEMDKAAMDDLAGREDKTTYDRMMERGGKLFYGAPAALIVLKDLDCDSNLVDLDCGIATQNIAIAAHSLGLGNCICGMMNIALEGPKGADFKKKLGINDKWAFGMSILVGYGADGKPHEPDMSKIVYVS